MPAADRRRQRHADPDAQAKAAQARHERLEALHQQLADGVAALTDGPAWRAWLDLAGRFHQYSFSNQLLIAAQRPDATHVAGYRAWQALGRQVRKGETAIWVLAPVHRRSTTPANDTPEADPDDEQDATGETRRSGRRIVAWTGAAVFDVSQTDGDPLPTPPTVAVLAGAAPDGLWNSLEQAISSRGFTVDRCPDAASIHGALGLTDLLTRTVTVRADVSDAQAVKTLAHEAGHVLLHSPDDATSGAMPACRDLIEVEAESVAYLIAAHHGLDTADYTFGYIAGWAGRDTTAVQATAQRVLTAAHTLLAHTDPDTTQTVSADLAHHATAAAQATVALADHAAATSDTAATARAATHSTQQPQAPGLPDNSAANGPGATSATQGSAAAERSRTTSSRPAADPDATRLVLAAAQTWFLDQAGTDPRYTAAVHDRGHQPDTCRADGIGWAPAQWTGLVDHLRDLGHTPDQILDSGVAILSRGRLLDRFRGRVTFPIHDHHGVVGWTARDTLGRPDTPKYVNTPTSPLYDKSRLLFGTPDLAEARTVVLVEGPWDAYAITQTSRPAVLGLATCGTAVTADQLQLATSANARLILGVDNDQAGLTALGRTLTLTRSLGMPHPHAVRSSTGKDLADQYTSHGPAGVRADLDHARPAGLTYADLHLALHPPGNTVEARVAASRAAAAQADGLTIGERGRLAHLLITKVGLTLDAALDISAPAPHPAARQTPHERGRAPVLPARPAAAAR